jgi:hypothetical protein
MVEEKEQNQKTGKNESWKGRCYSPQLSCIALLIMVANLRVLFGFLILRGTGLLVIGEGATFGTFSAWTMFSRVPLVESVFSILPIFILGCFLMIMKNLVYKKY